MATLIKFTVLGEAQTRGSKSGMVPRAKGGGFVMRGNSPMVCMVDSNKKSVAWMNQVRYAARQAYSGPLIESPVRVGICCYFVRHKSHYRTGRNAHLLKADAPRVPKADFDKITRAILDSLSKIVYRDDSLVAGWLPVNGKFWADDGSPERAEITIAKLDD